MVSEEDESIIVGKVDKNKYMQNGRRELSEKTGQKTKYFQTIRNEGRNNKPSKNTSMTPDMTRKIENHNAIATTSQV